MDPRDAFGRNVGIFASLAGTIVLVAVQFGIAVWWASGTSQRQLDSERAIAQMKSDVAAVHAQMKADITALQVADRELHKQREENYNKVLILEQRNLHTTAVVAEIKASIDSLARDMRELRDYFGRQRSGHMGHREELPPPVTVPPPLSLPLLPPPPLRTQ